MGNFIILEHSDTSQKAGVLDLRDHVLEYYPYSELYKIVHSGIKIDGYSEVNGVVQLRNQPYEIKTKFYPNWKNNPRVNMVERVESYASEYRCKCLYSGVTYWVQRGTEMTMVHNTPFRNVEEQDLTGTICISPDCFFSVENGYDDVQADLRMKNGCLTFSNQPDKWTLTARTNFSSTSSYTMFWKEFLEISKHGVLCR